MLCSGINKMQKILYLFFLKNPRAISTSGRNEIKNIIWAITCNMQFSQNGVCTKTDDLLLIWGDVICFLDKYYTNNNKGICIIE